MNTHGLTPDEFYNDREHFWKGFIHFVIACAVAIVLLLILMAIFLV